MKPWRLGTLYLICASGVVLLGASACAFHPDPTENNFYVKVVNDTSRTVILGTCGTGDNLCTKVYETGRVKPGGSWPTVQTSVGLSNPVLVRNLTGKRRGCLPLLFDYNATDTIVRVSEAVPCVKAYSTRSKPSA